MNIFEALEKGNGKAMLLDSYNQFEWWVVYEHGKFLWTSNLPHSSFDVPFASLKRNSWIPYDPYTKQDDVPRETCRNCKHTYSITDSYCSQCGTFFGKPKTKQKEVFGNVNKVRLYFAGDCPNIEKIFEKPITVTLEWQEIIYIKK